MELQRHRAWIRFALIYLAVTIGCLAVWILIAPKGFYDTFPGGGRPLGLGAAALQRAPRARLRGGRPRPRRARRAGRLLDGEAGGPGRGDLAWPSPASPTSPTTLTTTSHYSTGDNIASLFGLALDVAAAAGGPLPGERRRSAACDPTGGSGGSRSFLALPGDQLPGAAELPLQLALVAARRDRPRSPPWPPGSRSAPAGLGRLPVDLQQDAAIEDLLDLLARRRSGGRRAARWCRGRCRRRCRPRERRARARPSRPSPRRR